MRPFCSRDNGSRQACVAAPLADRDPRDPSLLLPGHRFAQRTIRRSSAQPRAAFRLVSPPPKDGRDLGFAGDWSTRIPCQICAVPAYGSCLGCVTAQVAVYAPAPVTREPGSESSTCFAGAYSPWPPPCDWSVSTRATSRKANVGRLSLPRSNAERTDGEWSSSRSRKTVAASVVGRRFCHTRLYASIRESTIMRSELI